MPRGTVARVQPVLHRRKISAAGVTAAEREANARLAVYCGALASPVRVRIIKLLIDEECVFGDLARKIPLAQSTISQHLRVLKEAGLVCSETNGQTTCYCIVRGEIEKFKKLIGAL